MKAIVFGVIVFGVLSAVGCARQHFNVESARQELLRRDAEWAKLASEGKDIDRIVSYWADDAQVIEPDLPIFDGKAAIRSYVGDSLKIPGFRIRWTSQNPTFSKDGKMAYLPNSGDVTLAGEAGALKTVHTRGLTIWRLDADAQWRCVMDIANEGP